LPSVMRSLGQGVVEFKKGLQAGRLHHKSGSHKDFFQIGFIQGGREAFVLDAYLAC
jgi:hypothetical protein